MFLQFQSTFVNVSVCNPCICASFRLSDCVLFTVFYNRFSKYFQVSKLEDRLKVSRVETENAKRELKDEQEGRKVVDKKIKGK